LGVRVLMDRVRLLMRKRVGVSPAVRRAVEAEVGAVEGLPEIGSDRNQEACGWTPEHVLGRGGYAGRGGAATRAEAGVAGATRVGS
jgi:hypothetical protein